MKESIPVPVYLTVREVSVMLCRTSVRARYMMRKAGCLVERGGRQLVPTEALKREFPELYERIAQEAYEAQVTSGNLHSTT